MKVKLVLFVLCFFFLSPILAMGQTIVLTTPSLTGVSTFLVSPASSNSLRRYVVQQVFLSLNNHKLTVMDSLASSTVTSLSDSGLMFAGIGNLYDDNHDELVVTSYSGLKVIDLQTGGTRYTEPFPANTYSISATLINYSSKTKPDIAVTYIGNSDPTYDFTRVYRFFTPQTGVASQGESAPQKISLSQNYPNPFNPTTTIEYELTLGSSSTLNIFDLTGRVVRSFDLGGQQTGVNHLVWDGGIWVEFRLLRVHTSTS